MKTLILPFVSAGNVPQLCTDVLLHSLDNEFRFVKELDHKWLHPFVGPLDYVQGHESGLYKDATWKHYTTPLELFCSKERQIYLLQQRSPIIQSYENEFCKYVLIPLIEELKVDRVLVLDTICAFESSVPIRAGSSFSPYSLGTCKLNTIEDVALEFEQRLQLDTESELSVNSTLFQFTDSSFQHSISTEQFIFKFSYHLLHAMVTAPSPLSETIYFSMLINEGDNNEDAHLMCERLSELVEGFPKITQYTTPISWSGVYGSKPIPTAFDEGLYI